MLIRIRTMSKSTVETHQSAENGPSRNALRFQDSPLHPLRGHPLAAIVAGRAYSASLARSWRVGRDPAFHNPLKPQHRHVTFHAQPVTSNLQHFGDPLVPTRNP